MPIAAKATHQKRENVQCPGSDALRRSDFRDDLIHCSNFEDRLFFVDGPDRILYCRKNCSCQHRGANNQAHGLV